MDKNWHMRVETAESQAVFQGFSLVIIYQSYYALAVFESKFHMGTAVRAR